MSKENIELIRFAFELLNLKVEKSKFYKIVRQPGLERSVFLQRCLCQLCDKAQGHFTYIDPNSLEEEKELEEEVVKHMVACGISQERRVVMGNGSMADNLLFWKKLLLVLQCSQAGRTGGNKSSDWNKSSSFMTELLQHPQLEKVLQPRKRQLDSTPENVEEEMSDTSNYDNQNDDSMEGSVSPTFQEKEDHCNYLCQKLKANLLLLHDRFVEFKDASKHFPRMETATVSGMGEAIDEQCSQLKRIKNFCSSAERIEHAVDFLTLIEPPNLTTSSSENLLFNNSCPDLLNGML